MFFLVITLLFVLSVVPLMFVMIVFIIVMIFTAFCARFFAATLAMVFTATAIAAAFPYGVGKHLDASERVFWVVTVNLEFATPRHPFVCFVLDDHMQTASRSKRVRERIVNQAVMPAPLLQANMAYM
jgi:hypothetical protein